MARASLKSARPPEPRGEGIDPRQLARLVGEARAAEGLDRLTLAGRINSLLIALRAPGNEPAEARAILAELDVSSLDGMTDGDGRDCRKEAVETLLACGFPHALNVAPEDLAHARRKATPQQPRAQRSTDGDPLEVPYYTRLAARFAWAGAAVQLAASLYWLPSAPYASLGALGAVMAGLGAWVLPRIRKGESLAPAVAFLVGGGLSGVAAAYTTQHPLVAATALTGWVTLILNRYAHPAGPD